MLTAPAGAPDHMNGGTTMMHPIKNADQIRRDLIQILIDDAVECRNYQRDVYMYVDDDDNAVLDLFVNVGGNSWIDDDHYCLTVLREHTDQITDNFETAEELADALGMTSEDLADRTYCYLDNDYALEELDFADMCKYAELEHADHLIVWMREHCDAMRSDFAEQADEIIRVFNERQLRAAQNTAELMALPINAVDYIEL